MLRLRIVRRFTLKPRRVAYAVRRSDGKYWAGPYRWQGRTFTADRRFVHLWGTEVSAATAVAWEGFDDVTVVRLH